MLQNIIEWLKKLFGIAPQKSQDDQAWEAAQAKNYADTSGLNLPAMIAGKLAHIVCGESEISVTGDGPRAEYIGRCMDRVTDRSDVITARALGIGGVVLKPYSYGTELYIDILDQSRFSVVEQRGEVITKAQFVAEVFNIDGIEYARGEYHTLGGDGTYTIENKATKDDMPIPLESVPAWSGIPEKVTITGVKQMLFAFVKCPTDNRADADNFRGVPVTYGQDSIIQSILTLHNEAQREYKLKRAFVGADRTLINSAGELPADGLFKLFNQGNGANIGEGKPLWEVFSPEIRHESYFAGLDYYFGLLEKAIGVNKGILTDLDTADATATAIKRSTFDTFNLVDAMRRNLEVAFNQIAYAFDVLANAGNFAPRGTFELSFDWSYALLENSKETFDQYMQAAGAGWIDPAEGRAWLMDETLEAARENIPELADEAGKHGE